MTRSAMATVLTALSVAFGSSAAEPYRPLPRLSEGEVNRRVEEQSPAPIVPPAAPANDAGGPPIAPLRPARDARAPTLETFQVALSPFGTWEQAPGYGAVWRPDVDADWRPYRDGQWIWTERGWSWSSDEPWGWATYHYGRWICDGSARWAWVPDFQWSPAWVIWRFDEEVVGWAPLFAHASLWAEEHPSARFWTFVPRGKFRTGVPVARAAYGPAQFDVLWSRFARPAARPVPAPRAW